MKIDVKSTFDAAKTMKRLGLGEDHSARKYIAARIKARCDPYVPMQSGTLKNTAQISSDGSTITYRTPYAHYQYHGMVMAGRAPKHYTGATIDYHGSPMRGKEWDKRMMADHREDIENDLAAFMNGGRK